MAIPDGEEGIREILRMRSEGQLFAELEGRRYVLMAYELYPNGTTSSTPVEDPVVAAAVGKKMQIGAPTDPNGWAIWEVPA